jgi:hypothetical protein
LISSKISGSGAKEIVVPFSFVRPLGQVALHLAALEVLGPDRAVAADLQVEARRKGVDNGDTDTVEASRDLVAPALAELSSGVKDGENYLCGWALLLGVLVDGDAAAVVDDGDRLVRVDRDLDVVAVAGKRLVDRVVDDLVDQVVKSARPGGADVHARALSHRIEPAEDGDLAGRVVAILGGTVLFSVSLAGARCFCHLDLSGLPRGSSSGRRRRL